MNRSVKPSLNRSSQTSLQMAKVFMKALVGDSEIKVEGTPLYSYFTVLDLYASHQAYHEIYQLPEHERLRDLVERLGLDGSQAG